MPASRLPIIDKPCVSSFFLGCWNVQYADGAGRKILCNRGVTNSLTETIPCGYIHFHGARYWTVAASTPAAREPSNGATLPVSCCKQAVRPSVQRPHAPDKEPCCEKKTLKIRGIESSSHGGRGRYSLRGSRFCPRSRDEKKPPWGGGGHQGEATQPADCLGLRLRFFGASITPVHDGAPQWQANAFLTAGVCRSS